MEFGYDLVDAKLKDRKAALMIKEGKDPNTYIPNQKVTGFSMGAPSKEKEP
jgi:hypothetical protein